MLRVLGRPQVLCDGVPRRELMRIGALSLFGGLTLPRWVEASRSDRREDTGAGPIGHHVQPARRPDAHGHVRPQARRPRRDPRRVPADRHVAARPADLRAPAEAREVDAPGDPDPHVQPRVQLARPAAVHDRLHRQPAPGPGPPTDPPDIGAICQYLGLGPERPARRRLHAVLSRLGRRVGGAAGPTAGSSGGSTIRSSRSASRPSTASRGVKYYDPVLPVGEPHLPGADSLDAMPALRLGRRRSLLDQLDALASRADSSHGGGNHGRLQRRAFALLTSSKTREAFDLSAEPAKVREAYGRNLTGSSLLTARRLVEAGVPFVSVHQEIFGHYGHSYDMHENNFGMLKDFNLPLARPGRPRAARGPRRPRAARLDAGGRDGRDGPLAAGQRQGGPRPLAAVRLQPAVRRRRRSRGWSTGRATGSAPTRPATRSRPPTSWRRSITCWASTRAMTVPDRTGRPIPIAHGGEPVRALIA